MNKQLADDLHTQLKARLLNIFQDYAQGLDVSPAMRYRTEGFAQALVAMGALSERQCIDIMAEIYQAVFGDALDISTMTSLRIPPVMKRAPVYPSTSE